MPPFTETDRRQKAVLWAKSSIDEYGRTQLAAAREIDVRWRDVHEEIKAPDGSTITIQAKVVVDEEITVGSQLFKGTLAEWTGTGSSAEDSEVMHVALYKESPSIDNREVRRTLMLTRYGASLGSLA